MPHPTSKPERNRALADQLYRSHYGTLLRIARVAGGGDEAEDAVSRGLALFIAKFDPDGEAPALPWLIVTIKREAWAILRHRMRRGGELSRNVDQVGEKFNFEDNVLDEHYLGPVERVLARERNDARLAALEQLKPHERICLGLKGLGYSYEEIQEITGWSYTKVNRLMVEGRAALRAMTD
jgi:RNA polymerase sigma factor (sigma-70 family)